MAEFTSKASFAQAFTSGYSFVRRLVSTTPRNTRGYLAESIALFARMTPEPPEEWKYRYDNLIRGLIADETWVKIDRLQVYGSYAPQPALLNIRSNAYNMTTHGGVTFTAELGYAGNGSSGYLSSGYAPAVSAGVAAQNSTHAFVWSNTNLIAPSAYSETGNSRVSVSLWDSANRILVRMHVINSVTEPVTSSLGMWGASRTASNQHVVYHDGVLYVTETTTSAAPSTDETYDLARNVAGVLTAPSVRQLFAVCYGAGLTAAEVAMLNGRVQAFKDNVPPSKLLTLDGKLLTIEGTYILYEAPE